MYTKYKYDIIIYFLLNRTITLLLAVPAWVLGNQQDAHDFLIAIFQILNQEFSRGSRWAKMHGSIVGYRIHTLGVCVSILVNLCLCLLLRYMKLHGNTKFSNQIETLTQNITIILYNHNY